MAASGWKEYEKPVERYGKVFGSTAWAAVGTVPYFTNMLRKMYCTTLYHIV